MVDRDKQHPSINDHTTYLIGKERSGAPFSSLKRWRSERVISEVILSHLKKISYTSTTALHNFALDKNIMVHSTTNIPAKLGCGLMPKLFLADMSKETTSVHINYNHRSRHH